MESVHGISVNAGLGPKYGLGLLPSDLETFQFPPLCRGFEGEPLSALDDPQNFYLSCPDTAVFGRCEYAVSRASLAIIPQSDCSTRTNTSNRNISPSSEIIAFQDKPISREIEAMYHDTTQSIISGRQSRAASVTWPPMNNTQTGLTHSLTPPTQTIVQRPQSFSHLAPQISQQNTNTPPPPPSSFFSSPNPQAQSTPSRSPFLSPNQQPALMTHSYQLPNQNQFITPNLSSIPASYYAQSQSQSQPQPSPSPSQQIRQQLRHNPIADMVQQQLQYQLQQQALALHQPNPQRRSVQGHVHAQLQNAANLFSQAPSHTLTGSAYQPKLNQEVNNTTQPTLPNTTGNSTTGYQCFSHGCGGRHFSNWGNLVRHHRERQLRSKAGAKPTCPRCGKGFTRSSARDAHVSGLKCVLGRRRRGTTGTSINATSDISGGDVQATSAGTGPEAGVERGSSQGQTEGRDHDEETYNGSDSSRDDSAEDEDEDEIDMLGSKLVYNDLPAILPGDNPLGFKSGAGSSNLALQQQHYER